MAGAEPAPPPEEPAARCTRRCDRRASSRCRGGGASCSQGQYALGVVFFVEVDEAGLQEVAEADDALDRGLQVAADSEQAGDAVLGHAVGQGPQGLVWVRGDRGRSQLDQRRGVGGGGVEQLSAGDHADEVVVLVEDGVETLGQQAFRVRYLMRGAQHGGGRARGVVRVEADRYRCLQLSDEVDFERVDGVTRGLGAGHAGRASRSAPTS